MGTVVVCFLLSPLDQCELSYRRYASSDSRKCPGPGPRTYCDATVLLGVEPWTEQRYDGSGEHPSDAEKLDPRWPRACAQCGYVFVDTDAWQVNRDRLFARSDGGGITTLDKAPPGAMWDAWWMCRSARNEPAPTPGREHYCGPDGMSLCVKLPDGVDWVVDGPASNGAKGQRGWTRTGVVPNVTASPSILTPGYHGFLRSGRLESC